METAPTTTGEVRNKRRSFSDEQKLRILAEVDAAKSQGLAIGDILRREGLHYKAVRDWREQLANGPKKRGRKPKSPEARRLAELLKENEKLQERLTHYEALTEAQGKVSALCVSRMNGRNEVVRTINAA